MTAISAFREAWVFTLAAILIFILSAAILAIPSFNGLMKVGLWALAAFGFTTSTLSLLASGLALRIGWVKLMRIAAG